MTSFWVGNTCKKRTLEKKAKKGEKKERSFCAHVHLETYTYTTLGSSRIGSVQCAPERKKKSEATVSLSRSASCLLSIANAKVRDGLSTMTYCSSAMMKSGATGLMSARTMCGKLSAPMVAHRLPPKSHTQHPLFSSISPVIFGCLFGFHD